MPAITDTWVSRLQSVGADQEFALAELRQILIRRIRQALRANSKVDEAFVEDTAQDSLVKILDCLQQFEGRSKFETWATAIAIRIAWTELRKRRWKNISLDQLMNQPGIAEPAEQGPGQAGDQLDQAQLVETMYQVINEQLTDKQRTALLAELAGCPLEEIGRRMESNRNAMYKLTHDARKRLKQGLESAGFSSADLDSLRRNRS